MSARNILYHLLATVLPLVLICAGLALALVNLASLPNAAPAMGLELTMGGLLMNVTAQRWRRRAGALNAADLVWTAGASSSATLLLAALLARFMDAGGVAALLVLPAVVIMLGLLTLMSFERLDSKLKTRAGAP